MIDEGKATPAETVIAKDQRSLFEQHTAADSATQGGNDLRQSFGHIADQKPHDEVGTDFTVAEDLHRRTNTVTPSAAIGLGSNTINNEVSQAYSR